MTLSTVETGQHLQVLEGLEAEPALRGAEIGVAVHDGVVTLFGHLQSHEQAVAAERAVMRVPGILAIVLKLVEENSGPHPSTDSVIAHAVVECLRRECAPPCAARAHVEEGCVTLKGEVDLFHQRDALERAVRSLPGVKALINRLNVRPPEAQADIHAKVRSAVNREMASLDPEHAAGHRPGETESTMVNGGKILIIDDDDDFRSSLRPVLENAGYTVFEGNSGHEGLEKLVEHNPDAIVLDIMMETGEEGYGVTQAIKYKDEYRAYRGTPIVMVSSIQETPDDRFPRAVELEMIQPDAYLTKPLDMDRFLDVIKRAVARRGRR
jgi:CheY-like chemotaxis protein/osmotically-inducible protein OsmY